MKKERVDVTRLCAEAVLKVPHEKDCNVQFGLACTCDALEPQRTERIVQGLAALLRSVARNRQALRDYHTEKIYDSLLRTFRHAAGAETRITIRLNRPGAKE